MTIVPTATPTGSAGSGIPARGLSRTDRASRTVVGARTYGPLLRIADNLHGRIDGARSDAPLGAVPWVSRLQATYDENALRILAGTRDVLAPQLVAVEAGRRTLASLAVEIADAERALAEVRAEDAQPGHGEIHLESAAVTARAERRAAAVRQDLRARLTGLQQREAEATASLTAAEGVVREEFGMASEVTRRMRAYYERRLLTYARQFLRRQDDVAGSDHRLTVPAWAEGPCPWLATEPPTASVAPLFR